MNTELNSYDLTYKQRRFCEEYMIDLNVTQAFIRAGYSAKSMNSACRIMSRPGVKEYVAQLIAMRSTELRIQANEVVKELARIAFADLRNYFDAKGAIKPIHEIGAEYTAALTGYRHTQYGPAIKLHDKIEALKLLGRHLGVFGEEQVIQNDTMILIRPQGNPYADKS